MAALASAAGVDTAAPRGIALLQVIRAIHEAPTGSDPVRDERVRRFRAYRSDLADFLRARRGIGAGRFGAALAGSQDTRRAVEDVAASMGANLDETGGVYRLVLRDGDEAQRRRRHLEAAGVDAGGIASVFNAGGAASLEVHADEVPLPLHAGAWARIVGLEDGAAERLLLALVDDRRASLLYHGLMSLDAPTRAYVAAHPRLLDALLEKARPALLASLGRSLRVRGGRIDVAGGASAVPAWEGLLGTPVTDPGSFILALLDRDRGRAALLYDTVDHLDAPRRAFVLGLHRGSGPVLGDQLQALLAACAPSLAGWDPEVRPFRRVPYDPVHLLMVTRVLPSGDLPEPAGRRFWQAVLAGTDLPDDPGRLLDSAEADDRIDAAWLVEHICVTEPVRRQQLLRLWLFGQRAFAGVAPAAAPQALVALRGFMRFPMLLVTLEHMRITDPALHANAVRHAHRLSEIGDREAAASAQRQFQAALSVTERIQLSRAVSAETVARIVGALIAIPVGPEGEYEGGVAKWLADSLLPALPPLSEARAAGARTAATSEAALLAAMAGVSPAAGLPRVEWEGLAYRVDTGGAEFDRLVRVRAKQGGVGLDAVLAFCRESARLQEPLKAPSDVAPRVTALGAAADMLLTERSPAPVRPVVTTGLKELVTEAVEDLRKLRTAKDLPKAGRIARPLVRAGDRLLGDVLASIAYAPHLGDPDGPELLAGDPSVRHDFGLDERLREIRVVNPWRLPRRSVGVAGGWNVAGSLLGFDVGLASLVIRRLETEGLPPPPGGNDIDRGALAAAVSLITPAAARDADRDALADAVRRGRARLRGLAAHPSALEGLVRAARLDEWWRQAVQWSQEHEPDHVPAYFSLADLARIGEAETTPAPPLDAWGAARFDTEGCLCLRRPDADDRRTLSGRLGSALVPEQFIDLSLRVAEALSDLGLPAPLSRSIMALATQDVLDAYRPAYIDDWTAMIAAVRSLSDRRFVDYVAALTSGGPLVPDDRERAGESRR
jgi:hypothetical protein